MKLTNELQEALLCVLCFNDEKASLVKALVPPHDFDPVYAEFAEAASGYLERFGKAPGEHTIDLMNKLIEERPKNGELYEMLYDSLIAVKGAVNPDFVIERGEAFSRFQRMKRGVSSAFGYLEKDDEAGLVRAELALRDALEQGESAMDEGLWFMRDPAASLHFLDAEALPMATGIPELDQYGAGPGRGRLWMFAARAKFGKSWFLIHLARQAHRRGKRVLYVTLEMPAHEISQRLLMGLFGVTKHAEAPVVTKILRTDKDDDKGTRRRRQRIEGQPSLEDPDIREYLRAKMKKRVRHAPILIKQFPTGRLTARELDDYLELLEKRNGFKPDLLIVDYVTIMTHPRGMEKWDAIDQLCIDLRGLAVSRDIAVASACQLQRGSRNGRRSDEDNLKGSYGISGHVDILIVGNQTDAEKKLGLARLLLALARGDADRFEVLITQSYALGQFVLQSTRFGERYFESLTEEEGEED